MNINKTADECIIELGIALFQCFADPKLSLTEKKEATKWITYFLDYQDVLNSHNITEINEIDKKLTSSFKPIYYQDAYQEFKNANIIFANANSLKHLNSEIVQHASQLTMKIINTFSYTFIKTMKKYENQLKNNDFNLNDEFIINIKMLFFCIHYHIGYNFQKELSKIVKTLVKILKTKIKKTNKIFYQSKNENTILQIILSENHEYFKNIQQIQLINFIHGLDDIFTNNFNINHKVDNLIFSKPTKIEITLNALLKKYGINLYDEIWKNDKVNNQKSNLLMHLFAYETYFLQGHNNHNYYEELILNRIITDKKFSLILNEYKKVNKIHPQI